MYEVKVSNCAPRIVNSASGAIMSARMSVYLNVTKVQAMREELEREGSVQWEYGFKSVEINRVES